MPLIPDCQLNQLVRIPVVIRLSAPLGEVQHDRRRDGHTRIIHLVVRALGRQRQTLLEVLDGGDRLVVVFQLLLQLPDRGIAPGRVCHLRAAADEFGDRGGVAIHGRDSKLFEVPAAGVSEEIERWLASEGDKTLGSIVELFEQKSFALLFILLLGVSALPLPTGGATHVFEIIAMLLAIQLIAGRDHIWLPERWRRLPLAGPTRQRFIDRLTRVIRWLERFSRPRATFLFDHRLSNIVFGTLVLAGSLAAFLAPPFSGLDTLPSLGVVLLSLGVLLEDLVIVVVAVVVGIIGVLLELVLGRAVVDGIGSLF